MNHLPLERHVANLPHFVLESLQWDIESLEDILRMMNKTNSIGWRRFWPRDYSKEDIIPVLADLQKKGLVRLYGEKSGYLQDFSGEVNSEIAGLLWFGLTPKGNLVVATWCCPDEYMVDSNDD